MPHSVSNGVVWLSVLVVLFAWVFHRLGAFDRWATVLLSDGTTAQVARTFGAVDHPFHATRAELLRRALLDGELLRWISAHQGGYPVEFYPLGAPAFEVLVWAALLGALPMMVAHKIAVILIFLLPVCGYLLLARADRITLGVGVLALVFHISVRGFWWSGGYWELVDWGLVSSGLAMALLVAFLPVSYLALRERSVRWAALASIVGATAVYTNVRSLLPLVAVALGMIASLAWEPDRREHLRAKAVLAGVIVVVAGLLAAPLLLSLVRFGDLYYFVIYEQYDSLGEYWDASVRAVSSPVLALAFVGLAYVLLRSELRAGRAVAFTLLAHVVITLLLSGLTIGISVEQLEATRLMPFQRALTMYLAALGVYAIMAYLAALITRHRQLVIDVGLASIMLVTLLLYVVIDRSPVPRTDRSLYPVTTTASASIVEQQRAVELAAERAPPGTAILVLGSTVSWHDQFWSFGWSDRPFYFNDWLWYWQQDLYGDYDPAREHVYPDPTSTLEPAFLETQGIGAIVATGPAVNAARGSPALELVSESATYSVFLVRDPTPIVTADGAETTDIAIDNQRYVATVSEPSTSFQVRRNWFPRWTATVDGRSAEVRKDENGFMIVSSDIPGTRVEVVYGLDGWDWLARIAWLAGIVLAAVALTQPRRVESRLGLRNDSS